MTKISNRKKKFLIRNYQQLSIEELAHKTGLKPRVVSLLINEYSVKTQEKDRIVQMQKGVDITPSWKTIFLTFLIFSAISFLIYFPSLHGEFVFDDFSNIIDNPTTHVTSFSEVFDLFFSRDSDRRVGYMSFALNYYFGGLDTFGFHLVNVIIHSLNGFVLFLLSYGILTLTTPEGKLKDNAFIISFLGSLLWLVHPIQSQGVAYIVQRLTSLATLFFLLSLFCYIKARIMQSPKKYLLFIFSLLLGLCALGTKQNAATLPLFIVLSELFFFQDHLIKIEKKKIIFLSLIVGLFVLIAWIYLGPDVSSRLMEQYEKRGWTPLERLLTQLRVVVFYLSLLIYPNPSRLNLDHDFTISHSLFSPFTTFLSLLLIIGLLVLAIFFMRRNRLVSFAIFWFFGNLVIESSIIPLELVFEHRLYLPSMSLIIVVIGFCFATVKVGREKWVILLIIPFILLFSYWTYERAFVWCEGTFVWMDAVKKSPRKPRSHKNLATAYLEKDMVDEAISEYKIALALKPDYIRARSGLGVAYFKQGKLNEAIAEYTKVLTVDQNHPEAYYNLGIAYAELGKLKEAIAAYRKALAIEPNHAEIHNNLGVAYEKMERLKEALKLYERAVELKPSYVGARINLGNAYVKENRLAEAIAEYKKILAVNPNHAEIHNNLGIAYDKKGMLEDAIIEYEQAFAIKPDYATAHKNLGAAYYKKGMVDRAIAEYKRAMKISPNLVGAYYDLADIYYNKGMVDEAISECEKVLTINPDLAGAYFRLGLLLQSQGKAADAINAYREVIRIKPNQSEAYNNLAWLYATSPEKNIRNGEEAVHLATKACRLTEFKKVFELGTLAAAYAEKGNFVKAIEYQEKALSLAENKLKPDFLNRLNLYQVKQPYRDR